MNNDDIYNNIDEIQNYIKLLFKYTNENELKFIVKNITKYIKYITKIINGLDNKFIEDKNDKEQNYNLIIFLLLISNLIDFKKIMNKKHIKHIKNIDPKIKFFANFIEMTYYKKYNNNNNYIFIEKDSTSHYYIWQNENKIIISIRGVHTEIELLTSLFGYFTNDYTLYHNYTEIINNIKLFIENNKNKEIYLLGHSMGGSMAINIILDEYYSKIIKESHVFNPNYHIFNYVDKKNINNLKNLYVHIIQNDIASIFYNINFDLDIDKKNIIKDSFKKYSEEYNFNYDQFKQIFDIPPLGNLMIYVIDFDDLKKYRNRHSIHMFTRNKFNYKKKSILEKLTLKYLKDFEKIPRLISW